MSDISLSARCRLSQEPRTIETRTGKPMTVCNAATNVAIDRSEDTETVWLSLLAFGHQAEELARLRRGDLINIIGRVSLHKWTTQSGDERTNWKVTLDGILSAKTTRPSGSRSSKDNASAREHPHQQAMDMQSPGMEDSIPF